MSSTSRHRSGFPNRHGSLCRWRVARSGASGFSAASRTSLSGDWRSSAQPYAIGDIQFGIHQPAIVRAGDDPSGLVMVLDLANNKRFGNFRRRDLLGLQQPRGRPIAGGQSGDDEKRTMGDIGGGSIFQVTPLPRSASKILSIPNAAGPARLSVITETAGGLAKIGMQTLNDRTTRKATSSIRNTLLWTITVLMVSPLLACSTF